MEPSLRDGLRDQVTQPEVLQKIGRKWGLFGMDSVISQYFPHDPSISIDIGGGMYGGALTRLKSGGRKILHDSLALKFKELGKLSDDIEASVGDFSPLPFPGEILIWK